MNYETLKATARNLEKLCNALLADINMGTLTPEAIHLYMHELETGDNSIYSALELELDSIEGE